MFSKEEASTPIAKVAEIVVRIRTELDAQEEGLKLRQLEGSAKEHLWQMQEEKRRPSDDESQFVRDMVHATFKDGDGYIEGLTKEKVDEYLNTIIQFLVGFLVSLSVFNASQCQCRRSGAVI